MSKELEEAVTMFKNLDMGNDEEFKRARNRILKELERLEEEKKYLEIIILKDYISKFVIKEKMEEIKLNKNHKYTAGTVVAIMNEFKELLGGIVCVNIADIEAKMKS